MRVSVTQSYYLPLAMYSIFSGSIDDANLPPIIPNTSELTIPPARAKDAMSGNITLPDTLRHNHAPFLLLLHDEEQSQSTLHNSGSTTGERAHDKRNHPHALDAVAHGDPCPFVQDTDTRQQLGPFRIPDRPGNASSTPPVSRRVSAGVARRNRLFALDENRAIITQADGFYASGALPLAAETEGPSKGIQADGGVRKADDIFGATLERWTESGSASLKPADISMQCDNGGSKIRACLTLTRFSLYR